MSLLSIYYLVTMLKAVMRVSLDIELLARKLKEMGFIEVSPNDLAELFGANRVWAGRVLKAMERAGLVERINSPKARPAKYRLRINV